VLLPFNFRQLLDERYAAEFEALALLCAEREVALQTIKSIALAPWDGRPQTSATWYEPLTEPADIELAVHWVLGREGVFLNSVGDLQLLSPVLEAAERVREQPDDETMQALVERSTLIPLFT
jgi:hypothetical protein